MAETQYVLSISYGKDSLACLGAIEQLGLPLDRIIHSEVWATDDIPADPPPMVEFKAKADQIIKERWGIEVEHLCAMKDGEKLTYEKLFYHVPNRIAKRNTDDWGGGGRKDFRSPSEVGAKSSKPSMCKFQFDGWQRRGAACGANSQLKTRAIHSRLPYHQRKLVYQRPQTKSFSKAPLHKERI